MKLEELMSRSVVTVRPDTSLKEVARILVTKQISGMPVVNDEGVIVGVISQSDVITKETGSPKPIHGGRRLPFRSRRVERFHARTASDVMTSPAITMEPYRSVAAAAQKLLENGIHRIPVVRHGRPIGIVTSSDLVRAFARPDEQVAADVRAELRYRLDVAGDSRPVEVDIDEASVSLRGTVFRRSTISDLEEAVAARELVGGRLRPWVLGGNPQGPRGKPARGLRPRTDAIPNHPAETRWHERSALRSDRAA